MATYVVLTCFLISTMHDNDPQVCSCPLQLRRGRTLSCETDSGEGEVQKSVAPHRCGFVALRLRSRLEREPCKCLRSIRESKLTRTDPFRLSTNVTDEHLRQTNRLEAHQTCKVIQSATCAREATATQLIATTRT